VKALFDFDIAKFFLTKLFNIEYSQCLYVLMFGSSRKVHIL